MKQLTFFIAFLLVVSFSNAQDGSNDFKPSSNDKTLEVQFAPVSGSPVSIGGLRFRSFSSSSQAFRANVFLGFNLDSSPTFDDETNTSSVFTIAIRPGIEKHLAGTDRLSPYYGAELDLGLQSSTTNTYQGGGEFQKTTGQQGFFRIGANLILGTDYYIAKKLFLGAEIGVGLQYSSLSDVKVDGNVAQDRGGEFRFGPNALGQLRLGLVF